METIQEFSKYLVQSMVDNIDAVKVETQSDEMGVLLSIKVAPEDMGKLIGKQGKTATAVREIIRIVGFKNKARVSVKIEEPVGGRKYPANDQSRVN